MADSLFMNIEIAPCEVKDLISREDDFLLVDVRERWEFDKSHIEGATLISMGEIPANLPKLEAAGNVVLYCHHGIRSLDAAAWLRSNGVEGARSMAGGIDRWSREVDPQVPRY
jgi:rhodanese-related sulfurtransferase